MKHFNITFEPDGKQISIHASATVLEAASQAGIILNTTCGGQGTCEKCSVIIEPDKQKVLACQHVIESDLTVTVPQTSRFFEQKILTHGIDIPENILSNVPDKTKNLFGVAVDIGTTTVVAKLIDLSDGKIIDTKADLNPQIKFGDDCISRINHAVDESNLAELQKIIIDCINTLIKKLCKQASIKSHLIYEVCIVGNTTMNHIFLKLPVAQLGQAPYKPHNLDAVDVCPDEIGLKINPKGNIHVAANIAGFVGSDITAVALAAEIDAATDMTLIVDIGTNGELLLGNKEKIYAASCAAGPAFEGARIIHGSRATDGAIEAVVMNDDDIDIDVIGNSAPRSLCGSGLIDAVAVILDLGVIDSTGRFVEPDKLKEKLPPAIFSRITTHDNQPAFKLAKKVLLTQADIRQTQLAKAAIRTGITLLLNKVNCDDSAIKQVMLAGAFGNYIRKTSALRIGLLPNVLPEYIHFIGNAAASGAQMILLSNHSRKNASDLAKKIEYVEIAHEKTFNDTFADSMLF
ncbi:MAG: DUF4445 domain-containing protein [Planctomycetes bacterium]|nr:DUF4445 domain-containing protein [Planctomycetota bacterium]